MPGLGVNSFFRIAKEGTWGTAESAGFHELPFISESLSPQIDVDESQSISSGAARPDPTQAGVTAAGTVEFELTYNLIDHFLQGVFGTFTESTPTGGTNARDHWAELATSLGSYTIELNRGDIEAADKVFVFEGMKVDDILITIPETGRGTIAV